ncbi:hypothetical protein BABINDRAFT_163080 [Babjeviella inositovora NRRL Y-12698]|uniref:Telomere-associated protein Rif1 N-terminal domain-containing protein n=1 Tax=Babjeviella inositovora NRRL Y-12698 TaxID=984486 RepID=A0A1E3QKA7_9ASCO|nr:uncharacterized protein BABINDRAFT_163080 [Babjeviella inositovora NRRL Y-12698]ODQ78048.1 hypothetical protein BABINDRAFT_163080 [Babjeviella inositovora NRRL Y-12698]
MKPSGYFRNTQFSQFKSKHNSPQPPTINTGSPTKNPKLKSLLPPSVAETPAMTSEPEKTPVRATRLKSKLGSVGKKEEPKKKSGRVAKKRKMRKASVLEIQEGSQDAPIVVETEAASGTKTISPVTPARARRTPKYAPSPMFQERLREYLALKTQIPDLAPAMEKYGPSSESLSPEQSLDKGTTRATPAYTELSPLRSTLPPVHQQPFRPKSKKRKRTKNSVTPPSDSDLLRPTTPLEDPEIHELNSSPIRPKVSTVVPNDEAGMDLFNVIGSDVPEEMESTENKVLPVEDGAPLVEGEVPLVCEADHVSPSAHAPSLCETSPHVSPSVCQADATPSHILEPKPSRVSLSMCAHNTDALMLPPPHTYPSELVCHSDPVTDRDPLDPSRSDLSRSSPLKRVTFSDNIHFQAYSEDCVSPSGTPTSDASRSKSILRFSSPFVSPANSPRKKGYPTTDDFWDRGIFVLLPAKPATDRQRLQQLTVIVDECIEGLSNPALNRKFEVYGTLHYCLTTAEAMFPAESTANPRVKHDGQFKVLFGLFNKEGSSHSSPVRITRQRSASTLGPAKGSDHAAKLFRFIQRDVETGEEGDILDPFVTRTSVQAVKIIELLISYPEFQTLLGARGVTWFYARACAVIACATVPKSLMSCYISALKCCMAMPAGLLVHQTLAFDLQEQTLHAVMNMKFYPSNSLLWEKLTLLRRIVVRFGPMMSKNAVVWVGYVLLNVVAIVGDLEEGSVSGKIMNGAILLLMEVAKVFLDDKTVQLVVWRVLNGEVPEVKCFFSAGMLTIPLRVLVETPTELTAAEPTAREPGPRIVGTPGSVLDHVHDALLLALKHNYHKPTMDVWLSLTLLMGPHLLRFGSADTARLAKWLNIHKTCFNLNSNEGKLLALKAWKSFVYVVCTNFEPHPTTKKQLIHHSACVKLLLHPFTGMSINYRKHNDKHTEAMVDELHGLFCAILYTLFNPCAKSFKGMGDQLERFWEPVVVKVLATFYFNAHNSSAYQHRLGFQLVNRLMRAAPAPSFNPFRCLAAEPVACDELAGPHLRWALAHSQDLRDLLATVVANSALGCEEAMGLFASYLACARPWVKKECARGDVAAARTDIDFVRDTDVLAYVKSLPAILRSILATNTFALAQLYRFIALLSDAVGFSQLFGNEENCIDVILRAVGPDDPQFVKLVQYIGNMLGTKNLIFVGDILRKYPLGSLRAYCLATFADKSHKKLTALEYVAFGKFLADDYTVASPILESLVANLFALPEAETIQSLKLLSVATWGPQALAKMLRVCRGVASRLAREFEVELLRVKCETPEVFFHQLWPLLTPEAFDDLFLLLRGVIVEAVAHAPAFANLWRGYLLSLHARGTLSVYDQHVTTMREHGLGMEMWEIEGKCEETETTAKEIFVENGDTFGLLNALSKVSSPSQANSTLSDETIPSISVLSENMSVTHTTLSAPLDEAQSITEGVAVNEVFVNDTLNKDESSNKDISVDVSAENVFRGKTVPEKAAGVSMESDMPNHGTLDGPLNQQPDASLGMGLGKQTELEEFETIAEPMMNPLISGVQAESKDLTLGGNEPGANDIREGSADAFYDYSKPSTFHDKLNERGTPEIPDVSVSPQKRKADTAFGQETTGCRKLSQVHGPESVVSFEAITPVMVVDETGKAVITTEQVSDTKPEALENEVSSVSVDRVMGLVEVLEAIPLDRFGQLEDAGKRKVRLRLYQILQAMEETR